MNEELKNNLIKEIKEIALLTIIAIGLMFLIVIYGDKIYSKSKFDINEFSLNNEQKIFICNSCTDNDENINVCGFELFNGCDEYMLNKLIRNDLNVDDS